MSPFCRVTGTHCLRLQLTPPMGFKARVDASSPVLSCHLQVTDPRSQFWPGWGPNQVHLTCQYVSIYGGLYYVLYHYRHKNYLDMFIIHISALVKIPPYSVRMVVILINL